MSRKTLSIILIWGVFFNILFPSCIFAVPDPNPGFGEVEKMLDEGGNFYLYCNTKDALKLVMEHLKRIFSGPDTSPGVKNALNSIDQVIDALGFYDIEDFGMSAVPVEDHYQTKSFIRIPRERKGILKITGADPHPCHVLEYAPKDTQLLISTDVNAKELLFLIHDCIIKGGGQNAAIEFDNAIDNFNKNLAQISGKEMTLQTLAASLDQEIALLIDIDPVTKINLPMSPGEFSQFPSPRFALLVRVKDSSLYEILYEIIKKNGLAQNEIVEGNVRKLMLPVIPNPFYSLQPVFACDGQYFILTTQLAYLAQIIETKKDGGGLKSSEEYKNIMRGMPSEGNGFIFISQNAFLKIQDVLLQLKETVEKNMGAAEMPFMHFNFLSNLKSDVTMGFASVRVNKSNGIWEISKQQNSDPGTTSLAAGIAMAGILTAIAVPGFLRAKQNAGSRACMENLIILDKAKEQWALENQKQNGAEVKMEDLVGEDLYLRRKPVCPNGGSYTLGVIGENPNCSCGTRLP